MSNIHVVKSWPRFYQPLVAGVRHHELRINDRDYHIGDLLWLCEYNEKTSTYTGKERIFRITDMTSQDLPCAASGAALADDHCILSVEPI